MKKKNALSALLTVALLAAAGYVIYRNRCIICARIEMFIERVRRCCNRCCGDFDDFEDM